MNTNITRFDYGRTRGWWVRFQRTSDAGKRMVLSKHFSDAKHGGKRRALLQARAWRDKTAPKVPPSKSRSVVTAEPGHGYVRRALLKRRASSSLCYVAWLRVEERRAKSTSYSIGVYGERGARIEAERWLERERRALRRRMRGGRR